MARILLTHSYFLRFDPKQWKAQQPYPPLATLYAAAILRDSGHEVTLYDPMFAAAAAEIEPVLKQTRPDWLIICDDGFNYLTKMCLTNMRDAAFDMIAIAKANHTGVIISSSDSTDHSENYLRRGADYIVAGEVEQTLQELLSSLEKSEPTDTIPGLRFLRDDKPVATAKRENQRELDKLPMPAWDLLDSTPYRNAWQNSKGYFSLNIGTTRGCPFKCNWCAKPIYGNRYNSRSPQNVVNELTWLKNRFGFDHIWFCDDIFGLKPGWVQEFARLIETSGLRFRFKIQSRVDLLLEADTIDALARAGCEEVWVGAESGSQKILDAMDKGTKVEQIHEATRLMKARGIRPCFFLQFGYPGETKADIDATLNMVKELMPYDIGISVSYPLPGTAFYENVKSQLKDKTNWTDSDELAIMFRSTYPPEFYKKLQRYVHSEFRKQQAFEALKHPGNLRNLKKAASLAFRIPQTLLARSEIRKYVA